jgi:hypothetical protein
VEQREQHAQTSSRKTSQVIRTLAVVTGTYSRSGVGEQASLRFSGTRRNWGGKGGTTAKVRA